MPINDKYKFAGQSFIAIGLLALAGAIFYFSYSLITVSTNMPAAADSVSKLSESIKPIIDLAPKILDESKAIREQTDAVVKQSQVIVDEIPGVVDEVNKILAEVEKVRAESAALRAEVEKVRKDIPPILDELAAYRELAPDLLAEVEKVRMELPATLDRVDEIVNRAEGIATDAGENAVTGFFTGLFKMPVNLMTGVTDMVVPNRRDFNDNERDFVAQSLRDFVHTARVGEQKKFTSSDGSLIADLRV